MMLMLPAPNAGTVDVEAKEVDGKAAEECEGRARRAAGESFTFHSVEEQGGERGVVFLRYVVPACLF